MLARAAALFGSLTLLFIAACTHPLDGARCDCVTGFTCCHAENRCIAGEAYCAADLACGGYHGPSCGPHGRCEDTEAGGTCQCEEGYEGPECRMCAEGFAAHGELCEQPCSFATAPACGEHGMCLNEPTGAVCACDEGYEGDACRTCAAGYVEQGDDCVSPCDAEDCGEHGRCELVSERATCVCDDAYTGPDCAACADGFHISRDGTCEGGCGVCPEHAACEDANGKASCACALGYADGVADDDALACSWHGAGVNGGGIADPGFEDELAWEAQGATFEPDAFGAGDQGVSFPQESQCDAAFVAQLIQMPSRALAEPLVLVVDGSFTPVGTRPCLTEQVVRIGESESQVRFESNTGSSRLCLGEAGFGPDVRVALVPQPTECPSRCPSRTFGKLSIEAALEGECTHGALANGDFSEQGSWAFHSSLPGVVSVADGLLSFLTQQSGDHVSAEQTIHVPTYAGAAVKVRYQNFASEGNPVVVQLDDVELFQLRVGGDQNFREQEFCIPRELKGTFRTLSIGFIGMPGKQTKLNVDAISIIDSTDCQEEAYGVQDPGLDLFLDGPWRIGAEAPSRIGVLTTNCKDDRCLEYKGSGEGRGTLSQLFRVPAGPDRYRVVLHRRAEPAADDGQIELAVRDGLNGIIVYAFDYVPLTSQWTEFQGECLPARANGRPVEIDVKFQHGEPAQDIFLDDVQLVPASDCP